MVLWTRVPKLCSKSRKGVISPSMALPYRCEGLLTRLILTCLARRVAKPHLEIFGYPPAIVIFTDPGIFRDLSNTKDGFANNSLEFVLSSIAWVKAIFSLGDWGLSHSFGPPAIGFVLTSWGRQPIVLRLLLRKIISL